MSDQDAPHGGYVDKVRDDMQRYVKRLLADNEQLRIGTARLESENDRLRQELRDLRSQVEEQRMAEAKLEEKLRTIRAESEQHLRMFAELEMHSANLANLYVASYQLHGTLRRDA